MGWGEEHAQPGAQELLLQEGDTSSHPKVKRKRTPAKTKLQDSVGHQGDRLAALHARVHARLRGEEVVHKEATEGMTAAAH
eukprot:12346863-Karenia_brevis.AAC.1